MVKVKTLLVLVIFLTGQTLCGQVGSDKSVPTKTVALQDTGQKKTATSALPEKGRAKKGGKNKSKSKPSEGLEETYDALEKRLQTTHCDTLEKAAGVLDKKINGLLTKDSLTKAEDSILRNYRSEARLLLARIEGSCGKRKETGFKFEKSRSGLGLMRGQQCRCDTATGYNPCVLFLKVKGKFEAQYPLGNNFTYRDIFAFKVLLDLVSDSLLKLRELQSSITIGKSNGFELKKEGAVDEGKQAEMKKELGQIPIKLLELKQDSIDLRNSIIASQSYKMGNIVVLQNFAGLPDDNGKRLLQYFAGYTLPLVKLDGKLVRNYRKPYAFVPFRNIYFYGNVTQFNEESRNFYAQDTLLVGKDGIARNYVNLLDLYQFARLKANMNLNLVSYISRYYAIYCDASAGIGRTWVRRGADTSNVVNSLNYGVDITLKTRFKLPINAVVDYKFFGIEPNTHTMFGGLNKQYSHISTSVAEETRLQTVGLPFSSFDLAFQYKFDDVKATTDAGSTSTGGDNSRVFYVKFGYVTNKVFGKRYGLDYNNYVTIQIGYSRSISEVFTAVKDLVGLGGSSSKTAD